MQPSARKISRLTELPKGTRGIVAKLKIAESEANRLLQLGLHQGCSIEILHGEKDESILLAVGDARIGVNYDIAHNIYVY